jgi:3-dehydroshikimate dehydratase
MFRPGLVSITFRKLTPAQIVNLVAQGGLEGIEWGGDVHVPHGDIRRAQEVRRMTADAGLQVAAYGSYYRLDASEREGLDFGTVLETAIALGAPTIRVWAGNKGSAEADEAHWQEIIRTSRCIADLADAAGIDITYEYHGGTLTDTNESALRLVREVNHPRVKTYWQPAVNRPDADRLEGLRAVLPWLSNIHAFYWQPDFANRRLLQEGLASWTEYLRLAATTGRDHWVMIEFVRDDSPAAFLEDAAALKVLIGRVSGR